MLESLAGRDYQRTRGEMTRSICGRTKSKADDKRDGPTQVVIAWMKVGSPERDCSTFDRKRRHLQVRRSHRA